MVRQEGGAVAGVILSTAPASSISNKEDKVDVDADADADAGTAERPKLEGRGLNVDAEYETDEAYADDGERMQLNPSTDLYDDYEDDDDEEDDNDNEYAEDENEEEEDMPEALPEARSLVQPATTTDEEEEDMGYDEDDERIAIAVERPKEMREENSKDFMNEEGSGDGGGAYGRGRTAFNRYKGKINENSHRFRTPVDKYRNIGGRDRDRDRDRDNRRDNDDVMTAVEPRESSGNFANDDEDDGDYESDEDEDSDGFFNHNKRKSSNGNRYFRKNTNDAIKIISTPLGKVGIVYQQNPLQEEEDAELQKRKKEQQAADGKKSHSTFTDFDALSPDPESSHRLASSHPKITPVLTPDGKVALLYRGDSESSKYEPIRNLTHKFNHNANANVNMNGEPNDNNSNNYKATKFVTSHGDADNNNNNNSNGNRNSNSNSNIDNDSDSYSDSETDDDEHNSTDQDLADDSRDAEQPSLYEKVPAKVAGVGDEEGANGGGFIIRPTDSVLPMINRPLSEVLGIKKNQFKQFRIKDTPTTTSTTESLPRTLLSGGGMPAPATYDHAGDVTTLHFLTKVNLADYAASARARNTMDFDFSRDNTMLDERTRNAVQQQQQQQATEQNLLGGSGGSIANEEVLAKTEVVNLAIVPHFDEELERLQRLHEHEQNRRHHRQRHRHKQPPTEEELSGIHCVMQIMMGVAAISTVFGMLGTFFKQRILDQLRLLHW